MKKIDIFIASYMRVNLTTATINYLKERTNYPYRLFLIDNGGNEHLKNEVDYYIGLSKNVGIHCAWNIALGMAESEYFITTDNDIYVPDVKGIIMSHNPHMGLIKLPVTIAQPDWLETMVKFMDERPNYGAISLHPHVFIGAAGIDPNSPEDVVERNMAGAVMRIMRREAVEKAGGWEHKIEAGRNHEERTICSRLQAAGYKVGITSRIRAFHPFPPNWGYPQDFTPEMQKHTPELEPYVQQFGNIDAYDKNTWLPK